jgi:hypothetical protein
MKFELWQVPVLVMAGIVLLEPLIGAASRRWIDRATRMRLRTASLTVLAVLIILAGLWKLGPDLADKLASVAAFGVGVATLWQTYRGERPPKVDHIGDSRADDDQVGDPKASA